MRRILLAIILLVSIVSSYATKRVFVLSIDANIDATAWRYTYRGLEEMTQSPEAYDLFVLHLNTYGGEVDMADSIRTAIMRLTVPTAAYIDHNAASAGALIALACDSTYMSPGASMGAATVVNQNGEPMPPKYQNYWSSIMRSTAISHGKYIPEGDSVAVWRRNPDIAADMVIPEKAIAFTPDEAVAAGMADGIATSLNDVLTQLDCANAEITAFKPTISDEILGFLASAAVRAVLIMLIIGGIYMEMHTAGLGFAGAVSLIASVLYFIPMVVTGTLAPWVLITFIIGVVLLALEVFVIPGFGVAGVTGIAAIATSLLCGMLNYSEFSGIDFGGLGMAAIVFVSGIILCLLLVMFLTSKYGPKIFKKVSLLTLEQNIGEDYVGVDTTLADLIGAEGKAVTDLRPAGKIEINGIRYDATSTGDFISVGTAVKVTRFEAAQLYVEIYKK